MLDTQHTLAVHIPAGAPEGFEEVFHGEADESTDWEAGDVVVRVRSQRLEGNGIWGRKENGIIGRITLSVAEVRHISFTAVVSAVLTLNQALLGFERQLKHLDGRTIVLSRTGTTQPGEVEVVEGEGVRVSPPSLPSGFSLSVNTLTLDRCHRSTISRRATCTSSIV